MKLVVGNLIDALALPAKIASKNKNTPILRNIAIRAENGVLSVTAADMYSACRTTAEVDADSFSAVVDPGTLVGILKTFGHDAEIEITAEPTEIRIRSGRADLSLPRLPDDAFPSVDIPEPALMLPHGIDFPYMFRIAAQCAASAKDDRMWLQCACIDYTAGHIYGTDGIQLAAMSFPVIECDIPSPLFIPSTALSYISDAFQNESELHIFNRGLLLRNKKLDIAVKDAAIPGSKQIPLSVYENWKKMQGSVEAVFEAEEVLSALARLQLLGDSPVLLTLSDGSAEFSSQDTMRGRGVECVQCLTDGVPEKIAIKFNPALLRGILHSVNQPTFKLFLDTPKAPIKITAPDISGFFAMLMPVA